MRVLAIADSDSYVKWAAALLARMPADWSSELIVVRTTKTPSLSQFEAALAGSGRAVDRVPVFDFDDMVVHVASERPDVVLVATIGPLADVVTEAVLAASHNRPVVVSGLPGIALPARRKALIYRSQVDLLVLHSKREIEHFRALAAVDSFTTDFGLARLPFLSDAVAAVAGGDDIVFAAQAIVPKYRSERVRLLGWLVELARRTPHKRVVIKVRARAGEAQTHPERSSFADLLEREFPDATDNLVVEAGPMAEQLSRACALVTVSSTAALEAIAREIPVLAVSEFGVTAGLINQVFLGSGLLGPASELMDGVFHHPDEQWRRENYFHDEADNDWLARLAALVESNRRGQLPPKRRFVRGSGGVLRRAWDRRRALGRYDKSLLGTVAVLVGTPLRDLVLAWRAIVELNRDEPVESRSREPIALDDEIAAIPRASVEDSHSRRDRLD